jgi:hypothetical protein
MIEFFQGWWRFQGCIWSYVFALFVQVFGGLSSQREQGAGDGLGKAVPFLKGSI